MQTKFIRRLLLVYFSIQVLPIDAKFWNHLFAQGWRLSYAGIFYLAHYQPGLSSPPAIWPDWLVFLLFSAAGAAAWSLVERRQLPKKPADDTCAFYWVRTLVRYRLAVAMLAYGFIKFFPLHSPFPSLSHLNTNYGDFTRWKLFSLSLGIVPSYESFLGGVEIVAALLLFYRRSASIGAFILAIFLGNVFMSNWAYGGGDAIYSLYLISLALFVVSYDAKRLADVLILQRPGVPNHFRPSWSVPWQKRARVAAKTLVLFVFVILYGFETRQAGGYQLPVTKGLEGARGFYNVAVFKKGRDSIGYSRTDSVRWQDVVFEKWGDLERAVEPVCDTRFREHRTTRIARCRPGL